MLTLLFAPLAHAVTDELGADSSYNNDSGEVKVIAISVDETVALTEVTFNLYASSWGTVQIVLYKERSDGSGYDLEESVDAIDAPRNGEGWGSSDAIDWVLDAGDIYLVGAYVEGYYYYYGDTSADPWFGSVEWSAQEGNWGGAPAEIDPAQEDHYYHMMLTSEDADVDDDGIVAEEWGGLDCDDTNEDVGIATEEVPYDGIDQDCDGSDLTDVDGDGITAQQAGGEDCDDTDPEVGAATAEVPYDGIDQDCNGSDLTDVDRDGYDATQAGGPDCDDTTVQVGPGMPDDCGDGVDQDCDGADEVCNDGGDDTSPPDGNSDLDAGDELNISSKGACGCDAGAGGAGLAWLAGLLVARRRR